MALRGLGNMWRVPLWGGLQTTISPRADYTQLVGPRLRATGLLWQQERSLATRIEEPLVGEAFFNRKQEVDAVRKVLRKSPQLSVFTGPVNSGKTSLLLKNLKEESDAGRAVLHIDLRDRSFRTVEGFVPAMEKEFSSWRDRLVSVAKGMKIDLEAFGVKAGVNLGGDAPRAIDRLDTLFKEMSEHLPQGNIWKGLKTPILFIDEANKLKTLLEDPDGHGALLSFFDWMVKNTKQISRFHVVLASSDSFFHLWINEYIGDAFFQSYVIGDLTKEEAKSYWEDRVVSQVSLSPGVTAPTFEEAYDICGGNLYFLRNYFEESKISQEAGYRFTPDHFQFVRNHRSRLHRALYPQKDALPPQLWTKEEFIDLMRALTSNGKPYLVYDDLCLQKGKQLVDSFIANNILHLRPGREFAYDLDVEQGTPIVTAESPAAHFAMRALLKKLDSDS